ncbi:MAG TPA: DUF2953 domain-containing protein [Firmicutes bacterium]|jgi:hypothetical protein|nr:DUF2953 domain-containing protein [Bacillota bacterium]
MSIFVAVIAAILRVLGVLAAVFLLAAMAVLLLPLYAKGAGFCEIESNLEEVLNRLDDCETDPGDVDFFFLDHGFELDVQAFLGLVSLRISDSDSQYFRVLGMKVPHVKPKGAGKSRGLENSKEFQKSKKHKKVSLRELKKFTSAPVRAKIVQSARAFFRAAHLEVDLGLEFGFFDPAHTGVVYGLLSACMSAFGMKGVRIRPNFQRQAISANGKASIWVMPVQIVWIAGRLMFAPEIRPIWWRRRVSKKE